MWLAVTGNEYIAGLIQVARTGYLKQLVELLFSWLTLCRIEVMILDYLVELVPDQVFRHPAHV